MSYGTAYDGLDADRAIFESAVRTLAEGNTLRATARSVQVDEHAAVGVAGFCPSGASTPAGARTVIDPKAHTRDTDSLRTWRPVTPAMAVGIADHGWATSAWLSSRVSAACLDHWRAIEYLSLHWDKFHHGS